MSSTGQLRKLGPALCLIAGLAAFGSGFAQDASPLEISTSAFQEIERTAEDGTTSIERVAASKVVPGGEVVYEISYQNRGSASATDVVINNPVPEGLEYTSSDKTPVAAVSVDGGNTFGDIADLDVPGPEGSRAAQPADVTHLRWVIASIPPGTTGTVEFRARVK